MPSLLRNVGYNVMTFVAGKGAAAIAGLLLIRILGPANAGFYSAALGFAFLFSVVSDLGLSGYATREISQHRERAHLVLARAVFIQTVLVVLAGACLALFLVYGGSGKVPARLVMLAFGGVILVCMSNPFSTGLQGLEAYGLFAVVSSVCAWLNALALTVVMLVSPTPASALFGWMVSNAVGLRSSPTRARLSCSISAHLG